MARLVGAQDTWSMVVGTRIKKAKWGHFVAEKFA